MGLNGAGKTSLLRILAGVTEPDLGTVQLRPPGRRRLLRAGARPASTPAVRCIEQMRDHATVGDTELRGLLGMFGLQR